MDQLLAALDGKTGPEGRRLAATVRDGSGGLTVAAGRPIRAAPERIVTTRRAMESR